MAESLEHFVLEHLSLNHLVSRSSTEIRQQALTRMDGVLANLPDSHSNIDCVEFSNIRTGQVLTVPAVLHLPHDHLVHKNQSTPETSFLNKYSKNSGIAFGCSENEAILHGLNEILERHILSRILMSLCGQCEPMVLRSPNATIMDEVLSENLELRSLAERMKIVLTETIHGVYFSMAIPKRPNGRHVICPVGSGCSLDPRIALERAGTELLQALELYDQSEKANDLCTLSLMESLSSLRPLIKLDVIRNLELTCNRLPHQQYLSVGNQIGFIVEKLATTGLSVYKRTLFIFSMVVRSRKFTCRDWSDSIWSGWGLRLFLNTCFMPTVSFQRGR